MNTIQLQNDISLEQYQMAVRVLEAIGIEVSDKIDKKVYLSQEEKEELQKGIDDIETGKTYTHKQVMDEINELWK